MATMNGVRRLHCITLALLTAMLVVASGRGAAAPASQKLPSATGRIQYNMTTTMGKQAGTVTGSMIISWTGYGQKFHQITNMQIPGNNQMPMMHTWSLFDGSNLYVCPSPSRKQVVQMKIPKSALQGRSPLGLGSNMQTFGYGGQMGTPAGTGVVLGRSCEIRAMGPVKTWIWKGLPLRMEASTPQGPTMKMVATKLETAPRLSPSLFKLPPGYTIQEMKPPQMPPGQPMRRPNTP